MTRHNKLKLDPHKDQILEWARQGKETRHIQALLKERGVEISHVTVANNIKRWMAPTINRINAKAAVQLETLEQTAVEALSKYATLCAKPETEMSIGERNYYRTLGEWFDRIARLRGLYAPTTQTAIAVQVNVGDFKKRAWELLNESESSGVAGSGSR